MTEKERKFILRDGEVEEDYQEWYEIEQFYIGKYRYRKTIDFNSGTEKYERIKKVNVAVGHNEELEITALTEAQYEKAAKSPDVFSWVEKTRHVYHYNGKRFEVDQFLNIILVICEIEDVEMDEEIDWPPFLKNKVIVEVTGIKEFSNKNLGKYVKMS